jgi:hypothetical protein
MTEFLRRGECRTRRWMGGDFKAGDSSVLTDGARERRKKQVLRFAQDDKSSLRGGGAPTARMRLRIILIILRFAFLFSLFYFLIPAQRWLRV